MEYEVGCIADLVSGQWTPSRSREPTKVATPRKNAPPATAVTPQDSPLVRPKASKIAFSPDCNASPKGVPRKRTSKLLYRSHGDSFQFEPSSEPVVNDELKTKKRRRDTDPSAKSGKNKPKSSKHNERIVQNEHNNSTECAVPNKKRRKSEPGENAALIVAQIASSAESTTEIKKRKKFKYTGDERKKLEQNRVSNEFKLENETLQSSKQRIQNIKNKNKTNKRKLISKHTRGIQVEAASNENKRELNSETEHSAKKMFRVEADDAEYSGNFSFDTADDTINDENEHEYTVTDFQKAAQRRIEKKLKKDLKFDAEEREKTLFVGNIPISILNTNYKRTLKNIFKNYGEIECIRIRNVPVEDLKTKPKVAFIKKKFHPEGSTVIAYIRFNDPTSVEKSLVENNTVIEGNHIRVDSCSDKKNVGDGRKTLFLGNLPWNVDEESVRKLFEKCGEIKSLRVVRDRKTHVGKGFGFVNFEKVDGVELALSLGDEDLTMNGKVIRIKRYSAHPNRDQDVKTYKNYSKNDGSNSNFNKSLGKKRDEQGNKIRKRNLLKNREVESIPNQRLSDSFDKPDDKTLKTDNSHSNFKGLVAKKKKKTKLNKGILKKKKISKILTNK